MITNISLNSTTIKDGLGSENADKLELSIPIICAADDRYSMQLATMIASILYNLPLPYSINLFIIDGGIEEVNKGKVDQMVGSRGCITYLQPSESCLQGVKVSGHVSIAAYYRLLIPDLLPHLDKVLYLDCDLVVNDNILNLWQQDVTHCWLRAVQDISVPTIGDGIAEFQSLGFSGNEPYFNSGVLLINLNEWRARKVGELATRYVQENIASIRYWDQDGLNVVISGSWEPLEPKWNRIAHVHYYSSWEDSPFEEKTYRELIDNPSIAHFTTKFKPWNSYKHPDKQLFYKYVDQTTWKGWRFSLWDAMWKRSIEKLTVWMGR
jgi:lipopolysaccharide biosynthesis glycosyltransferase